MGFVFHSPTTQFNPKIGLHLIFEQLIRPFLLFGFHLTLLLKTVSKQLVHGMQVLMPSHLSILNYFLVSLNGNSVFACSTFVYHSLFVYLNKNFIYPIKKR